MDSKSWSRCEERSGRRSQGLKIKSKSARRYISVHALEADERSTEVGGNAEQVEEEEEYESNSEDNGD